MFNKIFVSRKYFILKHLNDSLIDLRNSVNYRESPEIEDCKKNFQYC